jgi:chromosome segregation ATPase
MKNFFPAFLLGVSLLLTQSAALAQQSNDPASGQQAIEQDIQLLRSDLRSTKKQIVAANMRLTDAQAEKFWPVYDAYTQETTKLGDARLALIKDYAKSYDTMTDAQADDLLKRATALDTSAASLREQWIPKFRKVLNGKQTALFFQLDRVIGLLIDLQIASEIPLVK